MPDEAGRRRRRTQGGQQARGGRQAERAAGVARAHRARHPQAAQKRVAGGARDPSARPAVQGVRDAQVASAQCAKLDARLSDEDDQRAAVEAILCVCVSRAEQLVDERISGRRAFRS